MTQRPAFVALGGGLCASVATWWQLRTEALYESAGQRLAKVQHPTQQLNDVVRRPIMFTLRDDVFFKKHSGYHLLMGPAGSGKSVAVAAAAEGKAGVLRVKIGAGDDVVKRILRSLRPTWWLSSLAYDSMVVAHADLDTLRPVFRAAIAATTLVDKDWVPTVILDLEQGLGEGEIKDACRVAKLLTAEFSLAAVVVVAHDASLPGLPSDVARQVRVDSFASFLSISN